MRAVNYKVSSIFRILWCLIATLQLSAMIGSHSVKTHVSLAYNSPQHQAAGLIQDKNLKFMQSGVLVRNNIVITAAHGMELLLKANYPTKDFGSYVLITPNELTVTFSPSPNHEITYNVESILLDSRYIRFEPGDQHKFDIAILRLSKPVNFIEPIEISDEFILDQDTPMLVITWGNADLPSQKLKRAFYLFEWTHFFPKADEDGLTKLRTIMLSSLFFEPMNSLPNNQPGVNELESVQRRYFALKSWFKNGKKPYGLALPGTSGAPVFAQINSTVGDEKFSLFGLVMGYSTLGEQELALPKDNENFTANNAYNKYQTIVTTPFRLDTEPQANNSDSKHFVIDARYLQRIDELSNGSIK